MVGVVALGGSVAARLSVVVVLAVVCLVILGAVNTIRVLGELLDGLDDGDSRPPGSLRPNQPGRGLGGSVKDAMR